MPPTIRSKEGCIPVPRNGTIITKKIIRITGSAKSLLMTTHETQTSIIIYIGGHDVYCIEAQILKDTSTNDSSIGNFTKIRFDVACSLEHNFARGHDTNMLLKLLLTYILHTYPTVKTMRFNDHSFRRNECFSSSDDENASVRTCENGYSVELSHMLYIISGKTWYEKNFGAYLDSFDREKWNILEQNFQQMKSHISWNTMKDIITSEFPIDALSLQKQYESATTWQEFFGPLATQIGIAQFCNFIAPWLYRFIQTYFRFNFIAATYILPVRDYNIEYTISDYSREKRREGGTRFTRKKRGRSMKDER
jgi:hypothetical protein